MTGAAAEVDPGALEEVADAIGRARGLVALTGAGVSAESGVSTFRDRDGLWSRYNPEELATPEAFARDPHRVWEWYALRRRVIAACEPNPGHRAIAGLLRARADMTLVTQNVDGLHQRALTELGGSTHSPSPESRILELHGNLMRVRCSRCGAREESAPPPASEDAPAPVPTCPQCGGLLRPDVVWFGEVLDAGILDAAFSAARAAEICLVIGTSALVHPAASVPLATLESGGVLIEVNPEPTPLSSRARWSLRGPSGEILPRILVGT